MTAAKHSASVDLNPKSKRSREEKIVKEVLNDAFWEKFRESEDNVLSDATDCGIYEETDGILASKGGAYIEGVMYREVNDKAENDVDEVVELNVTLHAVEMRHDLPKGETLKDLEQVTRNSQEHLHATLPAGHKIIPIVPGMFMVVSPEGKVYMNIVELAPW